MTTKQTKVEKELKQIFDESPVKFDKPKHTAIPPIKSLMAMIHKQARFCFSRCPRSGIFDYEDLVAEGILVYHEWTEKFDPQKGFKFITGFTFCLRNHLASYLQKAHRNARTVAAGDRDMHWQSKSTPEGEYRIGLLTNIALTREEHLMARELMKDPRIKRSELWLIVGIPAWKGRKTLARLAYKLSEASTKNVA